MGGDTETDDSAEQCRIFDILSFGGDVELRQNAAAGPQTELNARFCFDDRPFSDEIRG